MGFKVPSPQSLSPSVLLAVHALKAYVDDRNVRFVALTTSERDALAAEAGMVVYNTTVNKHQGFDGTVWQNFY